MPGLRKNPLLVERKMQQLTFDQAKLKSPFSVRGHVPDAREIKKLMRMETASEAAGQLYPGCAIFGITKGQFSLIELITVILDQTGPADLFISTWTASGADISDAHDLVESKKIKSIKFMVDMTFQRRQPGFAAKIRELFGYDAIRVTKNHAKFVLIQNEAWNLVIKTSMNLNSNPRLEDFDIQDDPQLAGFLSDLAAEIWKKTSARSLDAGLKHNRKAFKKL